MHNGKKWINATDNPLLTTQSQFGRQMMFKEWKSSFCPLFISGIEWKDHFSLCNQNNILQVSMGEYSCEKLIMNATYKCYTYTLGAFIINNWSHHICDYMEKLFNKPVCKLPMHLPCRCWALCKHHFNFCKLPGKLKC